MPAIPRTRKTANVQPCPPANDWSARESCDQASPGAASDSSPPTPTVKRSARRRSATTNGSSSRPTARTGSAGSERTAPPDRQRHDGLRRDDDRAVGMHRRQEHGREGGGERGPRRPQLEGAGEEVGGERADEGEQRVHPPDRPVEGQHGGGRGDDRRCRARDRAGEPPTQVEAERDRRQREDDREPAQRLGRGVERERNVGEDEVERRPAPIPQHGGEQLAQRPRAEQAGDRLVLEERLSAHVGDEAPEKDRRAHGQRAGDEEPAEGLSRRPARSLRPGRPGRGAPVRGCARATRRRR